MGCERVLPGAAFPVGCQALLQDKPQSRVRSVLEVGSGAVQVPAASSPSCAASLSPSRAADPSWPSRGVGKPCN